MTLAGRLAKAIVPTSIVNIRNAELLYIFEDKITTDRNIYFLLAA